jgi:hypothetical protein
LLGCRPGRPGDQTSTREENHAMASRPRTKTALDRSDPEEPAPEFLGQRKRPESGRYRLQVDRQTKGSYATYEDAELAGLAIKKGHPVVQVTVYDATESVNKILELPPSK